MNARRLALLVLVVLLAMLLARGCNADEPDRTVHRADASRLEHPTTTTITTTTTSSPTSSTTTAEPVVAQRTPSTPPASVRHPGETTRTASDARLRSTAYCLTGGMASGRPTYVGAVAANRYPLGTRITATPNPWGDPNMIFTVEDRHKPGATELDFAMPSQCSRALAWGNRRVVAVRVVG